MRYFRKTLGQMKYEVLDRDTRLVYVYDHQSDITGGTWDSSEFSGDNVNFEKAEMLNWIHLNPAE